MNPGALFIPAALVPLWSPSADFLCIYGCGASASSQGWPPWVCHVADFSPWISWKVWVLRDLRIKDAQAGCGPSLGPSCSQRSSSSGGRNAGHRGVFHSLGALRAGLGDSRALWDASSYGGSFQTKRPFCGLEIQLEPGLHWWKERNELN